MIETLDPSKFKFKDYVWSFRKRLLAEFLADSDINTWKSFVEVSNDLGWEVENQGPTWRIAPSKNMTYRLYPDNIVRYPVAWEMVSHFGDDCPGAGYSALKPQSVIKEHIDKDNYYLDSAYLRIQIPLIIPKGDVGISVNGVKHDWSTDDIFIFNNAVKHHAWNNTDELRLIYLFDLPATNKYFDI